MFHLEMKLEPQQLLSAWRQETTRLVLPAAAVPRPRERAALRISVGHPPVTATVLGSAVSVIRAGGNKNILELAPEADSLPGLRLLLSAARGEPVLYLDRPQRWLARMPVIVGSLAGAVFMNTFSISARGCGLLWSGPTPTMGQGLALRFGNGARVVDLRGIVCWASSRGATTAAGVQFAQSRGAPGAWTGLLAEVTRSAPRA